MNAIVTKACRRAFLFYAAVLNLKTLVCCFVPLRLKTSLDLNEARDDWVLDAVASAGPHANNLHLAADR